MPSAPGLLFGPRPSKTLSDEQHRQLADQHRQRAITAQGRRRLKALSQASDAFLAGDAQPLSQLLAAKAVPALASAEREALSQTIDCLHRHYASHPSRRSPAKNGLLGLTTLQQLARQAKSHNLATHQRLALLEDIRSSISQLALAELAQQLSAAATAIGPLPRVWFSANAAGMHLRTRSGQLACGPQFVATTSAWHSAQDGQAGIFVDPISCPNCRRYLSRRELMDCFLPPEWFALWQQQRDIFFRQQLSSFFPRQDLLVDGKLLCQQLVAYGRDKLAAALAELEIDLPPHLPIGDQHAQTEGV